MSFQPNSNDTLNINGKIYRIAEHPYALGMPYGQEGRQAVVYKLLGPETEEMGLKVFKPRFRIPGMVTLAIQLAQFADTPGLAVCRRTVLSARRHSEVLNRFPDLTYAVLMPWVAGPTWMEVMLAETELTPDESLRYARFLAELLTNMEERNTAHCDLSGPNVIMTGMTDPDAAILVAMVDVEQLYGPGIQRPALLPGGSPGYAHLGAVDGIWSPEADRFAGAILIAEMLGWCDPRIRKYSWGESYFDPGEMQKDGERYQLLIQVLRERWGEDIAGIFKLAWESEHLLHAPTFGEWLIALQNIVLLPAKDDHQEAESNPYGESSLGSEPVVIERYFIICPSCKAKNEVESYHDITDLKCKSCLVNMDPFHKNQQETAASADYTSYSAEDTPSIVSVHRTRWGIFAAAVAAFLMVLGWWFFYQNGDMEVETLKLRLRTKEQTIRQVNQKMYDILLTMDDSELVKISEIKLRNETEDGGALGSFTNRFRQNEIRYIAYYLKIENLAAGVKSIRGKIYTKYIRPDGSVNRNPESSPAGFTTAEDFKLSKEASELTSGWGNATSGIYEVGIHQIEFWYNDRLLGKTVFTVY